MITRNSLSTIHKLLALTVFLFLELFSQISLLRPGVSNPDYIFSLNLHMYLLLILIGLFSLYMSKEDIKYLKLCYQNYLNFISLIKKNLSPSMEDFQSVPLKLLSIKETVSLLVQVLSITKWEVNTVSVFWLVKNSHQKMTFKEYAVARLLINHRSLIHRW